MSEYTFKNLSDVETVAEPADGTTVMGFQSGTPIQMPMSAVKGGGGVFVIDPDDPEYSETDPAYGDKVKEALLAGKQVYLYETLDTGSDYPNSIQRGYFNLHSFTPSSYLDHANGGELWLRFFVGLYIETNLTFRILTFTITT